MQNRDLPELSPLTPSPTPAPLPSPPPPPTSSDPLPPPPPRGTARRPPPPPIELERTNTASTIQSDEGDIYDEEQRKRLSLMSLHYIPGNHIIDVKIHPPINEHGESIPESYSIKYLNSSDDLLVINLMY